MCFKRLSIFSAPYFICLCYIDLVDSRLLMIPSERHFNQGQLETNGIIRKSLPFSMAKDDQDQFQTPSSSDKFCQIKLPYDDQLRKTRLSRFHLRLTRDTNPLTKQLIMMSLSKILNKCLELRLLPSVIMKQFVPVKQRVSRNKHKDSLARNRCNRLTKVLAYAQVILC